MERSVQHFYANVVRHANMNKVLFVIMVLYGFTTNIFGKNIVSLSNLSKNSLVKKINVLQGSSPKNSPDGTYLSTYVNGSTYIYDTLAWKKIAQLKGTRPTEYSRKNKYMEISPNGKYIYTQVVEDVLVDYNGIEGSEIRTTNYVYKTSNWTEVAKFEAYDIRYSIDNKYLFADNGDGISVYNMNTWKKIAKLEGDTPEYDLSHQYIFTENYGKTFVYDIGTWEKVAELDGSFNQFSFDNKFFFTTYNDSTYVYDSDNCKKLSQMDGNFKQYSPDGNYVFTNEDDTTYVYNSSNWSKIAQLNGDFKQYSYDSKNIFITTGDYTYLYDSSNWSKIARLNGDFKQYSPDGKYILSVATNNEITYIYDSFNLKYITQLIGADFEYSLDSRYVLNFNFISIVGSTEKASVYTANDWVKIGTISGNAFEFSPNSKYIFSAFVDYNGVTSYVYDINNCKPLIKMTDTYIETIDKYILSSYNDQTYVVYIDN